MQFPAHMSLSLEHNPHKEVYEPLAIWLTDRPNNLEWVSDEQKAKALQADEIWVLHWYPRTLVSFCRIAAADLDVLLAAAIADD